MSNAIIKTKIHPIFALLTGAIVLVFGLLLAPRIEGSYFLGGALVWYLIFGHYRQCFRLLPIAVIIGGIFSAIAYFASGGDVWSAIAMANRFGAIFLALIPGMACSAVRTVRSLSQMRVPRSVTLGMLIAMSFTPMLKGEIKRVREAMKTRGAGSICNPRIFYRAFLVPLVMRLVNISDTLALSVETRGFALGKAPYTIYKKESIALSDLVFLLGAVAGALVVVLI